MKRALLILLAVAGFLGCCAIDAETEDGTTVTYSAAGGRDTKPTKAEVSAVPSPAYASVPGGVEFLSGGEVAAFHVLSNPGVGCDPPHEGDCPGAEWATEGTLVFSTKPTYPETCYVFQESGLAVAEVTWVDSQTVVLRPSEGVAVVDTEGGWVLRGVGQ